MTLAEADEAARYVLTQLNPYCSRLEVAGSVRRRCATVKDLELVALPYADHRYLDFQRVVATWPKVKGDPAGRYTRRKLVRFQCELDLFIQNAQTWPVNLVIRTGCAEFSKALMLVAQDREMRCEGARLWGPDGRPLALAEEREVFEALGVPWHEPRARTPEAAAALLRPTGAAPRPPAPRTRSREEVWDDYQLR